MYRGMDMNIIDEKGSGLYLCLAAIHGVLAPIECTECPHAKLHTVVSDGCTAYGCDFVSYKGGRYKKIMCKEV